MRRNSKPNNIEEVKKFQANGNKMIPYRFGFLRRSMKYLWYKVCKIIMKYVSLDGRHMEAYGHHIKLLNHFIFMKDKANLADYVRHSMEFSVAKCKKNLNAISLHQAIML